MFLNLLCSHTPMSKPMPSVRRLFLTVFLNSSFPLQQHSTTEVIPLHSRDQWSSIYITVTFSVQRRLCRKKSFYDLEGVKSRNVEKFRKLENRMKNSIGTSCSPRRVAKLILQQALSQPMDRVSPMTVACFTQYNILNQSFASYFYLFNKIAANWR